LRSQYVAFKLKTGKTINKVLAGAGVVALGSLILNTVSPGLMQGTLGKVILPAVSFGVGGVESLAGAVVSEFAGHASGTRALDNTLTESL
jgi:hypothetical protein